MSGFRITYRDPDTGESCVEERHFSDSYDPFFISARSWAEDYAYALADKGQYSVREIT